MVKWCFAAFVRLTLVSFSVQNVLETSSRHLFVASVTIPPRIICTRINGLSSKQMRFCEENPGAMDSITKGFELGVDECKYQFRKRRWNCTLLGTKSTFGRRAVPGTKEAAFTHAIISAGIAQAVTLACTKGNLTKCGCDNTKRGEKSHEGWKWGGCSVNIQRGLEVADKFLNGDDAGRSDIALMNRHNNEVGREILKDSLKLECRCHGPSASCVTETCWNSLPSFREIGEKTFSLVDTSQRVKTRKAPSRSGMRDVDLILDIAGLQNRKPRSKSLAYMRKSPTYCEANVKLGIVGTTARLCNRTTTDSGNCEELCCGRGYDTHEITRRWLCHCRFNWCCHVTCDRCKKRVEETRCK